MTNQQLFEEALAAIERGAPERLVWREYYRAVKHNQSFWDSEAFFIIGWLFLLFVYLPCWVIWKLWLLVRPGWYA